MDTCRMQADPYIKCQRDAWEGDPDGLCLLHSRQVDKDKEGKFTDLVNKQLSLEDYNFRAVFFPGLVDFSGQKFTKKTEFFNAIFSGDANFSNAKFSGKANFWGANFEGDANFLIAIFFDEALFTGATFSRVVSFISVIFSSKADFNQSTFSGGAAFSKSVFSGEAAFFMSTFDVRLEFHSAIISSTGRILLVGINPPNKKKQKRPFRADFRFLKQEPGGRILLQDLCLSQVELTGTDMKHITLRNVDWHHYHSPILALLISRLPSQLLERLQGRQVVYDEIRVRERAWKFWNLFLNYGWNAARRALKGRDILKQENYARVEELYRGLKMNYGEMADYKRVGDFHYGEMEMHRRANPWRRWGSLYSAYWALSGYGERPLRAFIWLLLLIPAWAGLVWGLGIDRAGSQTPVNYGDTLLFIFEKATLQRPELPKGITWLGKFLSSLSVLLLPGQAALFILALRNRLGRRR